MPLTHSQTLGPGDVLATGTLSSYRAVAPGPGEEHVIRTELLGEPGPRIAADVPSLPVGERRAIACMVHMTDLHIGDVQSPARFEFFNREFRDPRFAGLIPTQRPQEALTAHALDALVRTLNGGLTGPITGAAPELVLTGGDAIDNGQRNEVLTLLRLLDGGRVEPNSGAPGYEGVQSVDWPDDIFWVPDGRPETPDVFVHDYGYPVLPGLLQRALLPFEAPGLRLPWLGCHGNHDSLCQGVGLMTPAPGRRWSNGASRSRCPKDSIGTRLMTPSSTGPRNSWPAPRSTSPRMRRGGTAASGSTSARTVTGRHRGPTGSTNATAWITPPSTSTTRHWSGSSCWTPPARADRPTSAWTKHSSAGSRIASPRCTPPIARPAVSGFKRGPRIASWSSSRTTDRMAR